MANQAEGAQAYLPDGGGLTALREAVDGCRGCALYRDATQAVFGAGPGAARLLLAGEQPGDVEDRRGEPFVGPAGRVLDDALEAAGIAREEVYLTNVVKHFKFTRDERGTRRLHRTPNRTEVVACRPWLDAEIREVGPEVVVFLGATRRRRCSARSSGSPASAAACSRCPTSWAATPPARRWPPCTRRRCCAPTASSDGPPSTASSRTCG